GGEYEHGDRDEEGLHHCSKSRGWTMAPSRQIIDSMTMSSSTSGRNPPSSPLTNARNDATLREYIRLASAGTRAMRSVAPMIVTPPWEIVSPATVSSQLPPVDAARSTM